MDDWFYSANRRSARRRLHLPPPDAIPHAGRGERTTL